MDGNGISARSLYQSEINEGCQLSIQPLDLLLSDVPISSLFVHGAKRLSLVEGIELSTLFDASFVQDYIEDDGLISHVLDWWPSTASMPVGFHVTAPMIKEELAPFVYDTHYAFDPSTFTVHYIHSALRDQSLLPRHCEAHRAEATQGNFNFGPSQTLGLLRCARNDAFRKQGPHPTLSHRERAKNE